MKLTGGGTLIADEAYLRESIVNPQAKLVAGFQPLMPTFQGLVSEEQLNQLLAYIKSLAAKQPGAGMGDPGGRARGRAAGVSGRSAAAGPKSKHREPGNACRLPPPSNGRTT